MRRSWLVGIASIGLLGCSPLPHRADTRTDRRDVQFATVEAKAFIIRDDSGALRAEMKINTNGNVVLNMYDGTEDKGKSCVFALTVRTNHTANLYFTDQRGRGGFDLVMTSHGPLIDLNPDTRIWFRDTRYSPRVMIGMASNDVPYLNWCDNSSGWIQFVPPPELGAPVTGKPISIGAQPNW